MIAPAAEPGLDEERYVEPADPSAQIEPVCLEGGAGVAGEQAGNCVLDASTDRVRLDQHELSNDFAGVDGRGVPGGSPLLMEIPRTRTLQMASNSPPQQSNGRSVSTSRAG